jgi:ADP-L-glycero-D-manno-heptose 6-epimerase
MNILVTGSGGFIGSHVARKLRFHGHNVIGYEYDENVFPDVAGLDWVIHLGAISSTTCDDVDLILKQNVAFTQRLWNECVKHDVKFQFASSASVYGIDNSTFEETDPVKPSSPYSWSKAISESLIVNTPDPKPIYQIFRYFNVYGPGEDHKKDQASPYSKFKRQATKEGKVSVFENSQQYMRDFVPIDYLLYVHTSFLAKDCSGIYNLGTGIATSFLDVAREMKVPIEEIPMPENVKNSYQKYTRANTDKLLNALSKV